MLIFIEFFMVLALIAIAFAAPSAGMRRFENAFETFDKHFSQLSRRRWLRCC